MRVRDIMTNNPFIIPEETSAETAARMMKDHKIGVLPIGSKKNIAGIVTDRDLAIRVTAESKDPRHTPVSKIMTREVVYCFEDEDIEDACFKMEDKHVRRLLVFDRTHDLIGILSLDDVAIKARKDKLSGYALRGIAKPA